MKIKYQSLNMTNFIGGMVGWLAFQKSGFEKAFYVWDADTVGDDPENADTVLMQKDYLSIRTTRGGGEFKEYITAIAEHLLGEPYDFTITIKGQGIVNVTRKGKENE